MAHLSFEFQRERDRLKDEFQKKFGLAEQVYFDSVSAVIDDLQLIVGMVESQLFKSEALALSGEYLKAIVPAMVKQRKGYLQLRVIDAKGLERFRVNKENGIGKIVARQALQNKSERPYFKSSLALSSGEVYISPLESNMENGVVVGGAPLVIRLGMPIFSSVGDKLGIVVINVHANRVLDDLLSSFDGGANELWVFDPNSKKLIQRNEKGFNDLNPDGGDFAHIFPFKWNKLDNAFFSELQEQGLYAHTLLQSDPSIKPSSEASIARDMLYSTLMLIVKVNNDGIVRAQGDVFLRVLPFVLLTFIAMIVAYWFTSFYKQKQSTVLSILDQAASRQKLIVEAGQAALRKSIAVAARLVCMESGHAAHKESDSENYLSQIVDKLCTGLDSNCCCLFEFDPERMRLRLLAGTGYSLTLPECIDLNECNAFDVKHIMLSESVVVVEDFEVGRCLQFPLMLQDQRIKSGAMIKVMGVTGQLGFLGIYSHEIKHYSNHDMSFLQSFASLIEQELFRVHFEERTHLLIKAIDAAADGVAIANKVGKVLWANTSYRALNTGSFSLSEMKTDTTNQNDKFEKLGAEFWNTINQGSVWSREYDCLNDEGERVYEEEKISAVIDNKGKVTHLVSVKRDVTRLRNTDEILKLQTSALNATADAIVITDSKAKVVWANPAYTTLTGYDLSEVMGKNLRLLKSGKHGESFYKNMWETIVRGDVWHGEIYNKKKDGCIYLEDQTITPVMGSDTAISNFIAIKRDVTEQEELKKQLQQAQKIESIGQLTGGIAHDFNNMLAVILGYVGPAVETLSEKEEELALSYLKEVKCSADRARDLVAQLLAFTRKDEIELCRVDFVPILNETLKMLQHTLPSSFEIVLDYNDVPPIVADPVKISQIIMNLCINARDAMGGKGVLNLTLDEADGKNFVCQSCQTAVSGDFVSLVVKDVGCGIPPEQIEKVFEPFFTTKEVGKGTGMGLSIVHGLMHQFGGHIKIESSANFGTKVTLLFPKLEPENNEYEVLEDSQIPRDDVQSSSLSLLVAEDEMALQNFISELLGGIGCDVTLVENGEQALESLQNNWDKFDLVITDQTMPKMSGIELARAIRESDSNLPIILCTGYGVDLDMEELAALDVSYLEKPIDSLQLKKMVRESALREPKVGHLS